jgi:plastocyanin
MSTSRTFVVAFVGALAVATCSTGETRPRVHHVAIRGMQFVPPELAVARGDVIVWTNEDFFPHTATAHGFFDSKAIESKKTWRFQAEHPGEFRYVCTLHPTMTGRLVVR